LTRERFVSVTTEGTTMDTSPSLEPAIERSVSASKLTVYHIDAYTTTRTAIGPEQVETFPGVEVHTTSDREKIAAAVHALRASAPTITSEQVEYRWKLVFEDSGGARLLEAYASSFQPYGLIGNTPVAFANDDFVRWLRETYAPNERPAHSTS
jgi:hypothetical protein